MRRRDVSYKLGPIGSTLFLMVWLVGAVMIVKWIIEGALG